MCLLIHSISTEWDQTFVPWLLAALHFITITFIIRKPLNYAQNALKLRTVLYWVEMYIWYFPKWQRKENVQGDAGTYSAT